jgi:2-C-methyl-D-erythritol 4-phosphate cytidylyltransferase
MQSNESDLSSVSNFVVVIPAAGVGKRFGGDIAKQYLEIDGRMILDITLDIFLSSAYFEKVVLVVSPDDEQFKHLKAIDSNKLILIDGGEQRQHSVNNALRYLYDNGLPDITPVLVHDAVRPCLSGSDLEKLIQSFHKNKKACFLAEPVSDSMKKLNLENKVVENISRDNLVRAQTPQMSQFLELKNALSKVTKSGIEVTDEVSALLDCDIEVQAVFSEHPNLKITHPRDLELAKNILTNQSRS